MNIQNLLSLLPDLRDRGDGSFNGPCPFCGGDDRFAFWINEGRSGQWVCRRHESDTCSARISEKSGFGYGDGIALVMALKECDYKTACSFLEIETRYSSKGQKSVMYKPVPATPLQAAAVPAWEPPKVFYPPSAEWSDQAGRVVAMAVDRLRISKLGKEYVRSRGFDERILESGLLGWVESDIYHDPQLWGMTPQQRKDGLQDKIKIPAGLLIATRRGGRIVNIVIRKTGPNVPKTERYHRIRGGGCLFGTVGCGINLTTKPCRDVPLIIGNPGSPVAICESALDALLIWQESGGTVGAIGMNGTGKPRDEEVDNFINQSPLVIAVPDHDMAGVQCWKMQWSRWFPQAIRKPVHRILLPGEWGVVVKDIGDLAQCHIAHPDKAPSVRDWLRGALEKAAQERNVAGQVPTALQEKLFPALPKEEPSAPPPTPSLTVRPPLEVVYPSEQWSLQAAALMERAVRTLYENGERCQHLWYKGFDNRIFNTSSLGYIERDEIVSASDWGLAGGDLHIPAGYLYAIWRKKKVVSIVVHRTGDNVRPGEQYTRIVGGGYMQNCGADLPYIKGKSKLPLIVCESMQDALLVWQETDGAVQVIGMTPQADLRDTHTDDLIRMGGRMVVVIAHSGRPSSHWRHCYPNAIVTEMPMYPFPDGDRYTMTPSDIAQCRRLTSQVPSLRVCIENALARAQKIFDAEQEKKRPFRLNLNLAGPRPIVEPA